MPVKEEILQQIALDVCQSMLGLTMTPSPSLTDAAGQLVASVEIRGERRIIVEVLAHELLTESIAESMYSTERGSLSADEIRDAFGEIANMIGGNLKGVFGNEADLSLPSVMEIEDCHDASCHERVSTTFDCCGHPLTIVVREAALQSKLALVV